ncbi:MAG TPA: amidohydrolase family protein [Chthoniobacterales bacterium]|jgi:imidazolonepropionase-like amidohydrolase
MRVRTILKRAAISVAGVALLAAALFTAGVLWPEEELQPVRSERPIAIVGVTIIDPASTRADDASSPAGGLIHAQTVVLEGDRIVAVGAEGTVALSGNAVIVDGRGRYLLPALWDMHTHVYAVSPLLDLPLYIAYGVTNVRDMQGCPQPEDPFIACPEDKRLWTEQAIAGKRVGPRVFSTTSFMANGPGIRKRLKNVPEFFETATPEQARAFVRHFAGRVEAMKVYDGLPRGAYFALVDEANRAGLDVVGHRPRGVSAIEAAQHQKSIEHARFLLQESFPGSAELRQLAGTPQWREDRRRMVDEHDPAMAAEIFAAMAANGTWYVPTHLTRWVDAYADEARVRDDPALRYLHPLMKWQWLEDVDGTVKQDPSPEGRQAYRDFYSKGLELTGAAHRAGVKVLAGTDYIAAGIDVHRELEQLVRAGLSPAEALFAATVAPTEYYGVGDRYGSVASGKVADLLLLDANPLEDIRNTQRLAAVIFNGNLYDRAALDRIRSHVEDRARSWSIGCKILWRFIKNPVAY